MRMCEWCTSDVRRPTETSPLDVGNVILTYNAMSVAQSLSLDLPSYILRHYPYYRDSFSHCVPDFDLEVLLLFCFYLVLSFIYNPNKSIQAIVKPASLKQSWDKSGTQIQTFLYQCGDMLLGILDLLDKPDVMTLESASIMLNSLEG